MDSDLLSPHVMWVLLASFMVAVMQAGFTCLESGYVRAKNSIHVAIKNLVDFCISCSLFTLFGYQIMFGSSIGGYFGIPALADYGTFSPEDVTFFIFQMMFCGTAVTIISGAVSERMRFVGYIIVTCVIAGIVYPVIGHWVWNGGNIGEANGWLAQIGFVDFAGSTVVHSVGGWIALSAILVIGPRIGRFGKDGAHIAGHNLPIAVLGVFLLLFGFFGFNGGSTLALNGQVPLIVANTAIAGALAGLTGMALSWMVTRHSTVEGVVNGIVSGLVASCANANMVGTIDSIIIGIVAGFISFYGMQLLVKLQIDDVIGAVPSHLFAGIWGTLAVAIFVPAQNLPMDSQLEQLGIQAFGILIIGLACMPTTYILFRAIDKIVPFRATPDEERIGLNIAEHAASSSLLDLITQMDSQARTGNFGRNVDVESETEAGQIAVFYNEVLSKVRTETRRRQAAIDQLTKLASTDALTGLPNRRSFFDSLRRTLSAAQRNRRQGAIMFIDLDGFKSVNDNMGHEAGDELLRRVSVRMLEMLRDHDVPARLGGDEFAILVPEVETLEGLTTMVSRLLDIISEDYKLPHGTAIIGASVGVAVFGGSKAEVETPEEIVQRADEKMYEAKLAGKGTWRLSEPPIAGQPPGLAS